MSTTLSTTDMVGILKTRVAIGLTDAQAIGYINQGFRWINTQGAFVWLLRNISVTPGLNGLFALPGDFDPGKPKWFVSPALGLPVPYKSIEDVLSNIDTGETYGVGVYSVWTIPQQIVQGFISGYNGQVYPIASAVGGPACTLYYHTKPVVLPVDPTAYFPTPDTFDDCIVDLAEAQVRLVYNMVGWDKIQARAEGAVLAMIDGYRTAIPANVSSTDQERRSKQQSAARVP